MIPPLLFPEIDHSARILDMCAAPGSKTCQLVELLHRAADRAGVPEPAGVVVANDMDRKRAYTLVHQTKRLRSPCVVVTGHEAQDFPTIFVRRREGHGSAAAAAASASAPPADGIRLDPFLFDCVLADVPCSGDGTMRKNMDVWPRWAVGTPLSLHSLQVRIAFRGAQLLQEGGYMVYSTCSMNPIENEAVVAELLRRTGGALELVDVSDRLVGLRRSPGLRSWRVMDKNGAWYSSFDDVPGGRRDRLGWSHFVQADTHNMPLDRCVRVFPHQQDTGAFFIALLRKTAPVPPSHQPPAVIEAEAAREQALPRTLSVTNLPFTCDEAAVTELMAKYGPVEKTTLLYNCDRNRPIGVATVRMQSVDGAQRACSEAPGLEVEDRPLGVTMVSEASDAVRKAEFHMLHGRVIYLPDQPNPAKAARNFAATAARALAAGGSHNLKGKQAASLNKEDPFLPLTPAMTDVLRRQVFPFYGIESADETAGSVTSAGPSSSLLPEHRLFVRHFNPQQCETMPQTISYGSEQASILLRSAAEQHPSHRILSVVNACVRTFARDTNCTLNLKTWAAQSSASAATVDPVDRPSMRVVFEGAQWMWPYVKGQRAFGAPADMVLLTETPSSLGAGGTNNTGQHCVDVLLTNMSSQIQQSLSPAPDGTRPVRNGVFLLCVRDTASAKSTDGGDSLPPSARLALDGMVVPCLLLGVGGGRPTRVRLALSKGDTEGLRTVLRDIDISPDKAAGMDVPITKTEKIDAQN